jgi:DNA repair and recombination protein RAD52
MFFNDKQQELLNKPLDGARVKTLDKAGRKFSYLPTFDIVNHLNLVFGYDGWETKVKKLDMLNISTNQNGNHVITFSAIISLKVWDTNHEKYIIKEDNGISVSVAKSIGEAMETASKASISDGLKRAAKSFGNLMGNALYDPEQKDVDYTNKNQSTQNFKKPQQQYSNQPVQQTNYSPNNQNFNNNPRSQDLNLLASNGITVVQDGNILVAVGNNLYDQRNLLKQNLFKFNSENKTWWSEIINDKAA